MIHVAFIDDNPDLREAIQLEINRSLGIQCVATFPTFEDAQLAFEFNGARGPLPDVVLLDLCLPGVPGLDAVGIIKARWPRMKILVFSFHDDRDAILDALHAGVDGYLVKTAGQEDLAAAIRRVHEGGTALSPRVQETVMGQFHRRTLLLPVLSPTEKKILQRYDRGGSYKEIADELGMSVNTVKTHAKRILQKCAACSLNEASYLRKQLV